jgi:ATP-dependent helicase/DNAse subunit B
VEQAQSFRYRQLTINTRIDRIDTLSDGSMLVIDYKTGASSPASWWGERPDDPQLPLYGSMISDTSSPVAGLAFAEINAKTTAYKGVGQADCAEPLLAWNAKHATDSGAQDWPQLREHWLTVLAKLADDFIAGEAAVAPKKPPESCRFCDYHSVCRIDVKEPAL